MNYTLKTTSLIFIFIFISCGYQKTEEDKHPEIPVFPEHTNHKIAIKQFTTNLRDLKYNEKNVFANNEHGDLIILDRKFNKIKELKGPYNYISKDGTIYFIQPNEKPELIEVYKMSIENNFKKEKIQSVIINSREPFTIRDSLNVVGKSEINDKDNVKINTDIDSLVHLIYQKEKNLISDKIKKLKPNLVSIFPLSYSVSVLKFKDKEFALYTRYDHTIEFKEVLEKTRRNGLEPIWNLEKSPKSFDKVVLGNSFSGNHYVGGFTPYGYNYVELSLHNEITRFKVKNSNNGNGVSILYKNKDTIILKDFEKLYHITIRK